MNIITVLLGKLIVSNFCESNCLLELCIRTDVLVTLSKYLLFSFVRKRFRVFLFVESVLFVTFIFLIHILMKYKVI